MVVFYESDSSFASKGVYTDYASNIRNIIQTTPTFTTVGGSQYKSFIEISSDRPAMSDRVESNIMQVLISTAVESLPLLTTVH